MWALDVLASERFTVDASMAPVKLVGDITFPRYPHTASDAVRRHSGAVPPLVADRFGQVMPLGGDGDSA